jgi:hypothetical protein
MQIRVADSFQIWDSAVSPVLILLCIQETYIQQHINRGCKSSGLDLKEHGILYFFIHVFHGIQFITSIRIKQQKVQQPFGLILPTESTSRAARTLSKQKLEATLGLALHNMTQHARSERQDAYSVITPRMFV